MAPRLGPILRRPLSIAPRGPSRWGIREESSDEVAYASAWQCGRMAQQRLLVRRDQPVVPAQRHACRACSDERDRRPIGLRALHVDIDTKALDESASEVAGVGHLAVE